MTSAAWQILVLLLLVAVVVQGLVLVGVMRQLGTVLLRFQPARPDGVSGPALGTFIEVDDLRAQPGVIFFLAPTCGPCEELIRYLPDAAREFPDLQFIGIPLTEDEREREHYAEKLPILGRSDLNPLSALWNINGTPYGVSFDAELRVVGAGPVTTDAEVRTLASAALNEPEEPHAGNGAPSERQSPATFEAAVWESGQPVRLTSADGGSNGTQ